MKIVIDATLFPDPTIKNSISNFGAGHEFLLLIDHKPKWTKADFGTSYKSLRFVHYDSFRSFSAFDFSKSSAGEVVAIVQKIIDDHNSLLLSNRYGRFGNYGPGIFHYIRYVSAFVGNVLQFLEIEKPDFVFYRSTPHSLQEWPFACVSEYLGIPVLTTERSVLPWRLNLNSGFRRERLIIQPSSEGVMINEHERVYIDQYFENSQGSYQSVIPLSDKRRLERNNDKIYNTTVELKHWWKRPDKMLNKYRCYQACVKYSVSEVPIGKYFVFFLHYQPERTSMPEGYGFSQQILAIQALRVALPADVYLVVKEHPSTFTNQCTIRERHPSFYKDIASMQPVLCV